MSDPRSPAPPTSSSPEPATPPAAAAAAWAALVDGLRTAGERLDRSVAGWSPADQADAYRGLLRALNNQLGRFEVDRDRPELVEFNGWREKFFMDNPDFRYWVADIRDDRRYRIVGDVGASAYQSITVYTASGVIDAAAAARLDSDSLEVDEDGRFEVTLSRQRPAGSTGAWLELPAGASSVWLRHFHHDVRTDRLGWCRIDPLDDPSAPPPIDPERFAQHLRRTATVMARVPKVWHNATAPDEAEPNQVRHWSEMTGGAAFTEPDIHYQRGSWMLEPGEALVLDGPLVACRYWNILLYSRVLNSLDHRHRPVSRTGAGDRSGDGGYRFVLAAEDPGVGDWLDTEGRPVGLFVLRFLQPEATPPLPTVRRVPLADLRGRP